LQEPVEKNPYDPVEAGAVENQSSIPVKMLGCAAKPWAKTRYSQKETGVHLIVVEESSQYLDAAEKLSGTAHEEWT
jgi:hypothetical protein